MRKKMLQSDFEGVNNYEKWKYAMRSTGIKTLIVTLLWGPLTIAAQKDMPPIDADCPDGFVKQIKVIAIAFENRRAFCKTSPPIACTIPGIGMTSISCSLESILPTNSIPTSGIIPNGTTPREP